MNAGPNTDGRSAGCARTAIWTGAAILLLLPLAAMRVTDGMAWDLADFVLWGVMLVAACGAYELAARSAGRPSYRAGAALAIATGFLLVWINLAVGVFGSESNPANLLHGGVLAIAILAAATARGRPQAMACAMAATALAQGLAGGVALLAGWGSAVALTTIFAALWLGSAWLFHKAAD